MAAGAGVQGEGARICEGCRAVIWRLRIEMVVLIYTGDR